MDLSQKRALWFAAAVAGASCAHAVELSLDDAPLGGTGSLGTAGSGVGPLGTAGTSVETAGSTGVGGSRGGSGGARGETGPGSAGSMGVGGATGGAGASGNAGSNGAGASGGGGRTGNGGGGGEIADGSAGSSGYSGDSGGGRDGGIADVTSEPPPVCPTCPLSAQYECFQNGASVSQLEFGMVAVNRSSAPIALNTITMRYWYTIDATGAQQPMCVDAAAGCSAVSLSVHLVSPSRMGADAYVEVGFVGAARVAPNADTGAIRISVRGSTSGNYDQPGDRSFQSTGASYVETTNVTAYVAGKLAWGIEPP